MLKRKISVLLFAAAGAVSAATLSPISLLNPAGSTSGQAIVSTGPSTTPAWGTVTAGSLTPITANSVYANFTGSSASPIANAVPSCSTANSALKYTSGTGLSCGTAFALTSGNLSQFASTTSAQLATLLSDETGSGAAVFGTSPTIASPTLSGTVAGAVTFSGAIAYSSTITPSTTAGIVGTKTNDNANAGSVGEFATQTSGSAVSMTSGTFTNITSISLTAGDWDVSGFVNFQPTGGATPSQIQAGVNTVSGTISGDPDRAISTLSFPANNGQTLAAPAQRLSLASTTTVYLVGMMTFTGGTTTATGRIRARRVR